MANIGLSYPFGPVRLIVTEGDSLTYGTQSTNPASLSYPSQLMTLYGAAKTNGVTLLNAGGAGDKVTDMLLAEQEAVCNAPIDAKYSQNIFVFWGGTNDLNGGIFTPAQVAGNINTRVSDALTAGFTRIFVLTILPRSDNGVDVNFEVNRTTLNGLVRSNAAANGYTVIDIVLDGRIGDSGDEADTTYYNADKVHLNNTGYGIIAASVKTVVG